MPEKIYILRWLCDVAGAEGNNFKPEWFQIINKEDIPWKDLQYRAGWDLAITEKEIIGTSNNPKEDPDYTAGIVIGIHEGNIYIVDLYVDRIIMGHEDQIEKYYKLWPKTSHIYIETNQFQKLIYYKARAKDSLLPVQSVDHYSVDKVTRILGLEPFFKQGRVFIRKDLPHYDELYGEYLAFPEAGEKRDVLDALEMAIKGSTTENVKSLGNYMSWL